MKRVRNVLGSIGLVLMVASFIWMQWTASRSPITKTKTVQPSPSGEPFAAVILDPGHGGQDSGAICGGILEKDLTLDVARRIGRLLEAEGIATLMTRQGDTYVSPADRAKLASRVSDCIVVSIHFNEDNQPVSSGVETYYAAQQITSSSSVLASWLPFVWRSPSGSPNVESQNLARFIQEALVARTRSRDRGIKSKQFFVIANVPSPAVLVEGGFLSNKEDISKLASEDYREEIAAAVTDGILRYRDAVKQRPSTLAVTAPGKR
jgi:N-acetylmuramoyl-L-alanine amidase